MEVTKTITVNVENCWDCPYMNTIHSDDAFTDSWAHHYCQKSEKVEPEINSIPDNCPIK